MERRLRAQVAVSVDAGAAPTAATTLNCASGMQEDTAAVVSVDETVARTTDVTVVMGAGALMPKLGKGKKNRLCGLEREMLS